MKHKIHSHFKKSIETKEKFLESQVENLEKAACKIIQTFKDGGRLFAFGNGGSASDAQHMVAEFVGRYKKERKAYPAFSLTENNATITAIGNDYGYENVFLRPIQGLVKKGDIIVGFTTSGRSKNVVSAFEYAKKNGIATIAFTGTPGKPIVDIADISILVPSSDTPFIQESHICAIHVLCELVEEGLCNV